MKLIENSFLIEVANATDKEKRKEELLEELRKLEEEEDIKDDEEGIEKLEDDKDEDETDREEKPDEKEKKYLDIDEYDDDKDIKELKDDEEEDKKKLKRKPFKAVAAEVGVVNRNGYILKPDSLKFDRELYPLLYNHGEGAGEVIGDVRTEFDSIRNAYVSEFEIYEDNKNIIKAVENGAFDGVSVSYYVEDFELDEDDNVVINSAIFKEVSLVSVGADPNARLIKNSMLEELRAEKKMSSDVKNALKEIEVLKAKYE